MKMTFLRTLSITYLVFLLFSCSNSTVVAPAAIKTNAQLNILFIVADDLGFTDIGAFGGEISTPTLDKLAAAGTRLTNMHAAPTCQPTRAMLMASTGYNRAITVRPKQPNGERDNLLKLEWAIIPELLQDAGYATYATGKWDLGRDPGYTAATRGFDRSFVQLNGSASHMREYLMDMEDLSYEDDGKSVAIEDLDEDFFATEYYTDKMLEYIASTEQGKPWFAYVPYTAPHWPLQLPDDWLHKYAGKYEQGYDALRQQRFESAMAAGVIPRNSSLEQYTSYAEPWDRLSADEQRKYIRAQEIFAGMVEFMDMSIGRILDYLESSGQLENTVIVFTADHGASQGEFGVSTGRIKGSGGPKMPNNRDNRLENFGRLGSWIDHGRGYAEASTAPYKFFKGSLHEGGLLSAGFVYYPAKVKAGAISSEFMTMMDFLPTFLDIAGSKHPGAGPYRGRQINDIMGESAWPHLTGQSQTVHDKSYAAGWSTGGDRGRGALIQGDFKIINTNPPGEQGPATWRLYNLVDDPGEHKNLAADNPELVQAMLAEWEANWR